MKKLIATAALLQFMAMAGLPGVGLATEVTDFQSNGFQAGGVEVFQTSPAVPAVGFHVGAIEIFPAIRVNVSHNDNIFEQEANPKSSLVTVIDPAVQAVAARGTNRYELNYHLSKGIYHNSSSDNYLDHFVGANVDLEPSSRLSSQLWANYNKTHDARGSTFTGLPLTFGTPDKYHETSTGGKVSYGINARIVFKGDYTVKRYENHRSVTVERDLDTTGFGIALFVPIAPKTSAVAEIRYKHFNYIYSSPIINLDSNEMRYFAGLDWEATAKTTGTLRLGYLNKNFASFNQIYAPKPSQISWELGVLWEPMTYSSWKLLTTYAPAETDGIGSYRKVVNVNVAWKHGWSSYLKHNVTLGYGRETYQGLVVPRKDRLITAGISFDYAFRPWLTVGVGYNYANRNSNEPNSSFRQNVWALNLIGTL